MAKKDVDDMTEIILKDAAAEIGVQPGYLRTVVLAGKLKADKHGGRDWWIKRADLLAFDKGRQPRGRPLTDSETANREQERKRAYQREYRRKYRERQKQAATDTAASSKPASKSRKDD